MGKIAELFISIGAKTDKFNKGMSDVQRSMQKVGKKMQAVGKTLTKTVTLPLIALGAASVKAFADFDKAMTESLAIMGNVSDEMKQKMRDVARTISEETTFSAKELAEAYYFLASAGMSAEQSVAALDKVAKFAQAGTFDLSTATDLLTDAQTALALSSDDAAVNEENLVRISDVLVGANTLANASVQQFSEALTNKAAPAMRSMGIEVEEGVAVLAAYADAGVKGQLAGTRLTMMLNGLQEAARSNKEEWDAVGISLFDANENFRSVADIIGDLEGLLGNMTPKQRDATIAQLGFNIKTKSSILTLMGVSEKMRGYTEDLKNMGGITEIVAEKQLQTFSNQLKLLWNKIVNLAASIGEKLVPALMKVIDKTKGLVDKLKKMSEKFDKLSKPVKTVIAGFIGFVAMGGPMLVLIGKLTIATNALAASNLRFLPVLGRLVAGILAGYAAYKLLLAVREQWEKKTGRFTEEETKRWAELNEKVGGWTSFVQKAASALKDAQNPAESYRKKIEEINAIWDQYGQNTEETLKAIAQGKHGKDLKNFLKDLGGKHLEAALASGKQADEMDSLEETIGNVKETVKKLTKGVLDPGLIDALENAGKKVKTLNEEFDVTTRSEIEAKLQRAKEALGELESSGEDTWEQVKDLKEEIQDLSTALDKRLAPAAKRVSSLIGGFFIPVQIKAIELMKLLSNETVLFGDKLRSLSGFFEVAEAEILEVLLRIYDMFLMIWGIQIPELTREALEKMARYIQGYSEGTIQSQQNTTMIVQNLYEDLADHIATFMTDAVESVFDKAKDISDIITNLFDDLKKMVFKIIKDILKAWITDLLTGMVKETTKAAPKINKALDAAAGTTAKTLAAIGKGLGKAVVAIAEGVAAAAAIIVAAAGPILIAAGIALAIYTGFKAIGSLFGSKKKGVMEGIREFTKLTSENTKFIANRMIPLLAILEKMKWPVVGMGERSKVALEKLKEINWKADNIQQLLDNIKHILTNAKNTLEDLFTWIKNNLATAQHGMNKVVTQPTLILAGEAGAERVQITPHPFHQDEPKMQQQVVFNPSIEMNISAIDSQNVYDFMAGAGKDALVEILERNVGEFTSRMKREIDQY